MANPKNKQLATEYADLASDVFNSPFYGGILRNLDDVLQIRAGGKGLKLYDEIERDATAFAVLQKRKLAVIARPWRVIPASKSLRDKKAAEFVETTLQSLPFDRLCLDLLDSLLKGFALVEILWELQGDALLPTHFLPRDQRRFAFDTDRQPRLLTRENMLHGEELPQRKFIHHSTGAKDASPYGRGLGYQLFFPVLFKRQNIGFWLAFAERCGTPTVVGKYDVSANKEDRDRVFAMGKALGQDSTVVIPASTILELLEPKSNFTAYEPLCAMLDEQIALAVLGETMTTKSGGGGLGGNQSAVHNEVRKELAEADADLLSDTLNTTLVKWLVELNIPNAAAPRVVREFEEPADLQEVAQRIKLISDATGYVPTLDYITDTFGGEWVARAAPTPMAAAPIAANTAALAADVPRYTPNQQVIEDRTDDAIEGLELGILDEDIKQAIREATTPEELTARLAILLRDHDSSAFDAALSQALFAADVMGYVHAGIKT